MVEEKVGRMSTDTTAPVKPTPPAKKKNNLEFLDKPILDTMEDYYKFEMYCDRPDMTPEKKKCTVSPEIFEILAKGQETPFLWIKNVQVFNAETKEQAEALLRGNTATVIIR